MAVLPLRGTLAHDPKREGMQPKISDPILTPRLCLRPFAPGDAAGLFAMESDPEVKQFTGGVLSREGSDRLLNRFLESHREEGLGPLAITHREPGPLIGLCGLLRTESGREHEIFFGLARHAWGHGYAVEACRGLVAWLIGQAPRSRVIAWVAPENERSARTLLLSGFRREFPPAAQAGSAQQFYVSDGAITATRIDS